MPVDVQWYIPNHVLISRFYGDVTPQDIRKQYTLGLEMSESVNTALVHLITDVSEVQSFPKNVMDMKDSLGTKARNAGWVVLVGENKMIRFLSSVVSNLMKLRFTYVNTLEEALKYITDRDPNLDIESILDMTVPYGEDES